MSFAFRLFVCLLALSLPCPAWAQSQSIPNSVASSETRELAAALAGAATEEEQNRLLAQKPAVMNSALLAALKAAADPLVSKAEYEQALKLFQLTVRIAERIGDRPGLGHALCDLGAVHDGQNRGAQALDYHQKGLAIFEETGDKKGMARALFNIGVSYSLQRRFDRALEYYGKSLPLSEEAGDRNLKARILNGQGLAHSALGQYELGLELYERSRALSEELNDRMTLEITLNNLATHYTNHGRFTEALEYLLKSLKIHEELGGAGDKRSLGYRLQNIGLIYRRQGRNEQALEYARKSLKLLAEAGDKFGIANLQNNIGVIYKANGSYEQAQEWFEKSKRGYEEIQARAGIARSLNNLGDLCRLQGRYEQALDHLQTSLRLRTELGDRGGVALTLNNLGWLYQAQGRHEDLLEVGRRAAGLAEELNAPEELWKAREQMGIAFRAMGQPAEARRNFLAAIAAIESLRHEVAGGGQQQQSFLENKLSPWLGMVELLVSQNETAEALHFAEQSKARVLLDVFQAGRATLRDSLSPRERQAESEHRVRLSSLNTQLSGELRRDKPNPARVAELKASVEKARLDYESLETSLYVSHPELKVRRGEASIIKAEELAALLPDETGALLEYVVADDRTYLFAITKAAEVRVFPIAIKRADLAKQIESLRGQLAARDLGFRASARKLHALLLEPAQAVLRGKSSLVIVPDDKLWELPFQALLAGDGRYVMEHGAVSYAPSLTVLREMKALREKRRVGAAPASLLALANPALGQPAAKRLATTLLDTQLDPLPEAEAAARTLGRLYGPARSKVYTGAKASEDRVKAEAAQAAILHFATHGVLNDAAPMYSHLVLAPGSDKEDGLLEAWELMQLDLKADLAVLSACETARGRFSAGEGVIGLTWALFVAGVPATVVSQWKVESAGTRDLMLGFHRQLRDAPAAAKPKASTAEALRQAALRLMKNPQTSHPFYWAGFVFIGADH
jgi:CHAT domain-containing protein/Tfp pilus assembly protein PilF